MKIDANSVVEGYEKNKGIAAYVKEATAQGASSAVRTSAGVDYKKTGISERKSVQLDSGIYGKTGQDDQGSAILRDMNNFEAQDDPNARRNQMAVMANTVSPEDWKEMQEEGFDPAEMEPHKVITVTDQIKAKLAQAGVDVSYMPGELDTAELEAITGSAAVAAQIMQSLSANDLPVNMENIADEGAAMAMIGQVDGISKDMIAYMVRNDVEPTIENLYKAQYSSGSQITLPVEESDYRELEAQIAQVLEDGDIAVTEEAMNVGKWLLANDIPLTAYNVEYVMELEALSDEMAQLTIDEGKQNELIDAMSQTITEGKRPQQTNLLPEITAKRVLEETRLKMTVEVKGAMEKQGLSIDTSDLEATVEELKVQEKAYYASLLEDSGIEVSDENIQIMEKTASLMEELRFFPADAIQLSSADEGIEPLAERGKQLLDTYEKANTAYETMMTTPRSDMGDSITKAFQNVDAILEDLDLETTADNQRAVRILARNEIAINKENITMMKQVDEEVQRTFKSLTPGTTLAMIRRGINPLDMTLKEINDVANQIQGETGEKEVERFSEFLWKLEQKHEITPEERESYIGIYRLMHQVEKNDGAVIGALQEQGADFTMRNLLTISRSKKKAMEYAVDDTFAGVEKATQSDNAKPIDVQIESAYRYQMNCLMDVQENLDPADMQILSANDWMEKTPEECKEMLAQNRTEEAVAQKKAETDSYVESQLERFSQAADTEERVYRMLDAYDIPSTTSNVEAMKEMMMSAGHMFEQLFANSKKTSTWKDRIFELKDEVLENFAEALENPTELAEAQDTLAEVATNVMKSMIFEDDQLTSVDLREMQLMCKQFSLCAQKAKEECYMIPLETSEGGVTGVTLKVMRGKEKNGLVDILFESSFTGKVAASFEAKEDGVSGMIAVEQASTKDLLSDNLGLLAAAMNPDGDDPFDVKVMVSKDVDLASYEMRNHTKKSGDVASAESGQDEAQKTVQTKRLYHIAKAFIETVQDLTNV